MGPSRKANKSHHENQEGRRKRSARRPRMRCCLLKGWRVAHISSGQVYAPLQRWAEDKTGVPLDKREGSVKGKLLLGGVFAPLVSPERLRTKALEISYSVSAGIFPSKSKPVKAKLIARDIASVPVEVPCYRVQGLHQTFEMTGAQRLAGDSFVENKGTSRVRSVKLWCRPKGTPPQGLPQCAGRAESPKSPL